jgi:hypothetical protein
MPASSRSALQLLQLCVRCYHPQLVDLELLMPALLPFFASTLFTLPDSLQSMSLSLLHYLREFPPPLLSCFAAAFSRPSLPAATRQLLLQMVASHRITQQRQQARTALQRAASAAIPMLTSCWSD